MTFSPLPTWLDASESDRIAYRPASDRRPGPWASASVPGRAPSRPGQTELPQEMQKLIWLFDPWGENKKHIFPVPRLSMTL